MVYPMAYTDHTHAFLDASTHLYKRVFPSVRPSVRNAFVSNTRNRVISASEVEGRSSGGRRREEGRGEGGRRGEEKEVGGVRGARKGVTRGEGRI